MITNLIQSISGVCHASGFCTIEFRDISNKLPLLLHTDKTRNERVTRDETCPSLMEPLDIPTDQHMHTSQDAATQPQTAQKHGMGAHPSTLLYINTARKLTIGL